VKLGAGPGVAVHVGSMFLEESAEACQDFFRNNSLKFPLRVLNRGLPDAADSARRGKPISLSADALGPNLRRRLGLAGDTPATTDLRPTSAGGVVGEDSGHYSSRWNFT
jgi:hypothetical protein